MSNNTILGTKPFSDYMSVVEAASKIMKIEEHCGVCDEQGIKKEIEIEEAVLADKDYKYDGKVVKISKKNFSKVHKDFKNSTKGKERMMINDPKTGGSISVPVQFEEVEKEVKIEESVSVEELRKAGAPFEDLRSVADAALKIMTGQPQEVKEEEKEVTTEDDPQQLTEQIV